MSQLPLMVGMCFVAMFGAVVARPRRLQIAAMVLAVCQVGMTIYYVASRTQ